MQNRIFSIRLCSLLLLFLCFACPLQAQQQEEGIVLTKQEKQWLEKNNYTIRLAPAPNWEPMEKLEENGEYTGLVADYMHLLGEKLSITFHIIHASSWSAVLDMAEEKKIHIVSAAIPHSAGRRKNLLWTTAYFSHKACLLIRSSSTLQAAEYLHNKRIGAPKEYVVSNLLKKQYPDVETVEVRDYKEGIAQLAFGGIDALLIDLITASYYVDKYNFTNLKLGKIFDTIDKPYSIGVREDIPILHSILEKAVLSLTEQEKNAINKKWIRLSSVPFYRTSFFFYLFAGIIISISLIIFLFYLWNRTLKREVIRRTKKLIQLKTLLIKQEKMVSLGHIAAGIAHEIRNPLFGINLHMENIDKLRKQIKHTEVLVDSIEQIKKASGKIETIISRVMDFAKPGKPNFTHININEPIEAVLDLSTVTLRKKGITVDVDLAKDLPRCSAESQQIEEVLLNLINNAVRVLENSPVRQLKISSAVKNYELSVYVEDSGPGIDPALVDKIFEPFVTGANSSGLGLAICQRIVFDHGGYMGLKKSSLGGACFSLTLPALIPPAEQD